MGFLNQLLKHVNYKQNDDITKKNLSNICENSTDSLPLEIQKSGQKIFFSYGHDENVELVSLLKKDIEARGHNVWIDTTNIKSGEDWRLSITEGLTSSAMVLSFLSNHSVRSPGVCLDELKIALCVKGSYIKTVLLENENHVHPPTTLLNVQWLDMSDWKDAKAKGKTFWDTWYAKRFAELCTVVESDEAQFFSGEIQRLRSILRPNLSDTKEQYLLRSKYLDRIWLNSELEQWRVSKNISKVFVLLGGPGVGKSCFAAHQLHYNHNILCGIFCEWDKSIFRSAKNVFQTLAFKLATKLPDYRKILLEKLQDREGYIFEEMTPSEYFDSLLSQPLNEIIDGGRERQIILIDGLDEVNDGESNELAEVISDNIHKLPSWIAFLLTSRPEYNICALYASYNPFILEQDDNRNLDDIRTYITSALVDDLVMIKDRFFILQEIVRQCNGSFLYATLFVEGVKTGLINLVDTKQYPKGLDAFYFQNFRRKFPNKTVYRQASYFLELLSACQDIPINLIMNVLKLSKYELNDLLILFVSLLQKTLLTYDYAEGKLECLSFCHKSLSDWMGDQNKAGTYFIDNKLGSERLARYSLEYLKSNNKFVVKKPSQYFVGQAPKINIDILDDYIQTKMPDFFIRGNLLDEYCQFLLENDTPLMPYWLALEEFPKDYDYSVLIDRLWADPKRYDFFKEIQEIGKSQFIMKMINYFIDLKGFDLLDILTLNIYIDIVHLRGDYRRAVMLCDNYLCRYQEAEIFENKELIRLYIRKLHHSMFFAPVKPLIEDAIKIEKMLDSKRFPEEFNELLFLIGGNLGVLHGNFTLAREYIEYSLNFARTHDYFDYESRSIRKYVDLMCLDGRVDEALDLLSRHVSYEKNISRYQLYLLSSLGEIFRRKGDFDKALECFMLLDKLSEQRGILGWQAHAQLAMANLFFTKGYIDDAKSRLENAGKIYQKIDQKWGIFQVEIIRYGILLSNELLDEASGKLLKSLLERAQNLQYLREIEVIKMLLRGKFPSDFQLLFL